MTAAHVGADESRAATDALLAGLRSGGWGLRSWGRFAAATASRSAEQAAAHPRAVAEVTALHALLAMLGRRRRWTAASWVMAVTHLGLLGPRHSIGAASTVSLVRANLPALGDRPWLGLVAIGTDRVDGALARRAGPTHFGHYADSLADAAFWAWFTSRHERDRRVRAVAALAWAAPVVAVTVVSVARGRMVEVPRPAGIRPAAALQAVVAARALHNRRQGRATTMST